MENDNIVDLLKAQDWKNIFRRLTYYATWRAKFYSWNSASKDELSEGKTPEDLAATAIEKVWSGTRDWDPKKYPDLLTHLMWIVKSDMEHLFSSQGHQLNVRLLQDNDPPDTEDGRKGAVSELSLSMNTSMKIKTAEEELIMKEDEGSEETLKTTLYEMVKGDEDLEILLVFFEDGIDKPETIAAEMGWDIAKVYNLKRKLFRKASKLLNSSNRRGKGEKT